jgi:hypothetical protein
MAESQASAKRRSAREWQTLVSKVAESGEDLTQFCRRQGNLPANAAVVAVAAEGRESWTCADAASGADADGS